MTQAHKNADGLPHAASQSWNSLAKKNVEILQRLG